MKKKRNSKYISFYFNNFNIDNKNKNVLPLMKRSNTNKEMNATYNQEEINKRILRKINYNYIISQFNLYCKNSQNKKSNNKYLTNLSHEFFNNTKSYSRNRTNNFRTQTIFYKKNKKIKKEDFLFATKENFFDKNDCYEEEKIYDFRQIFSEEKDKISQLKKKYRFYNLPKFIKDEISSKKMQKVFSNDFEYELNNKYKPKNRIISKIKNRSFNEKIYLNSNETKNTENKNNKNTNNEHNNTVNIKKFVNKDLKKKEFNSISISDFKLKLKNPIKKQKSNFLLNCMKLTKKYQNLKLILK